MKLKACPCPTCGHVPTAKRIKPTAAPIDVSSLTDAELFKYRAKTAPYCDVQFFVDCGAGLSPELLEAAELLASHVNADGAFTGMTRSDFYRQYYALSSRRRMERSEADYARIMAAVALTRKARAWAAMIEQLAVAA